MGRAVGIEEVTVIFVRGLMTAAILFGVYGETGTATTVSLLVVFGALEAMPYLVRTTVLLVLGQLSELDTSVKKKINLAVDEKEEANERNSIKRSTLGGNEESGDNGRVSKSHVGENSK